MLMAKRMFVLSALLILAGNSSAMAQDLNALENLDMRNDPGFQEWLALPEDASMEQACSNELKYGNAISDARANGATLAALLRWAEQEAEKSASLAPDTPLFPIGTDLMLTKLIQASYLDTPIYKLVPGGFPQFAYRSCLKGRSVDR